MNKNLEIIREAREKYEKDVETVKEMIALLVENRSLIKIKFQTDYKPFKFKVEDIEYTALYKEEFRENNGDALFEISREDQIPHRSVQKLTIGQINITEVTFKSWNLKEFAKVLTVYKNLMEEDFVASAKDYLA